MGFSCLKGCVNTYNRQGVRKAIDASVLMPWVEVTIADGTKTISVGNWSSSRSKAVIESFQFGMSTGIGVLIEIVDEEGGDFEIFFRKIVIGNKDTASKQVLKFRFGWAWADCNSDTAGDTTFTKGAQPCFTNEDGSCICTPLALPAQKDGPKPFMSCQHSLIITSINCDVSRGVFKYSIEGTDLATENFTSRSYSVFPKNGGRMFLTDAITECLKAVNITPSFKSLNNAGVLSDLRWEKVGDCDVIKGPKGEWHTLGRDPIAACRDWLQPYCTEKKKGIVVFFDTQLKGNEIPKTGKLVFLETAEPVCNQIASTVNFGTYIVNGGACSPVISFTPKIKYVLAQIDTGTLTLTPGAQQPRAGREFGPNPCFPPGILKAISDRQGFSTTYVPSRNEWEIYRDQAGVAGVRNLLRHNQVNQYQPSFQAELKVQGDPSFDTPLYTVSLPISIVFLNPFRVGVDNNSTCEWLSTTDCNKYLSNSSWLINGIHHEIRDGSFTTDLRLKLLSPVTDLLPGSTFGAVPFDKGGVVA